MEGKPMPVAKITKSVVDKMDKWTAIWDRDLKGFGVRRHGTLGRHYLLRFRFNGRQTMRKIGRAGSPWTPDTARAEALRLLGLIVTGTNPSVAIRQDSFALELSRYFDSKRRAMKSSAFEQMQRHLVKQALPLHSLPLAEIDR